MVVTIFSSVLAIIALVAIRKDSKKLTKVWKIGLVVCAGMVGAVGHQGGEMSYGKDFYPRALRILTGAQADPEPTTSESEPANENTSADLGNSEHQEQDALHSQPETALPAVIQQGNGNA